MGRSVKKGPFCNEKLLEKVRKMRADGENKVIKIWYRSSTVLPEMVGLVFAVHDGRRFVPVRIIEDMVGHKFGEFVSTRKFGGHSGSKTSSAS